MQYLDIVSFEEVLASYGGQSEYGRKNILLANQKASSWNKVFITREEAEGVLLPTHNALGCEGKLHNNHNQRMKHYTVVPLTGATVKKTQQKIKSEEEQFKKHARHCFENIAFQKKQLASKNHRPLFLAEFPLRKRLGYLFLRKRAATLFHLDGLHRLLALTTNDINPRTMLAYVAKKNVC